MNPARSVSRPAATDPAIELADVAKSYGGLVAVDHVDLTVEPGEFITFLGPSGSGKTTTLNMIAGFVEPDSGSIALQGRPVAGLPPHRRDLGMVFQNYALFTHLSVAENIAYPLRRRHVAKAERERRVGEALEMVRMTGYGGRYPAELSGGQQQRIALARALVYEPGVLLMDEPLGALDRQLREWLQSELRRLHREVGATFVSVTHDQDEALAMSDRVAVFNGGRIEQVGTAEQLYEQPNSLFVGRFVGESTVFEGPAAPNGESTAVAAGPGSVTAPGRAEGKRAAILIRPENLRLDAAERRDSAKDPAGTGAGRNTVPVRVLSATYLGASRRVEVELPGGGVGVVRVAAGSHGYARGDLATMSWEIAAGVLLEA